jgi:hypothetical protein
MSKISTIPILVLLAAGLAMSAPAPADNDRTLTGSFSLEPDQALRLELPTAELRVEASEGNKARLELRFQCRWENRECTEALEDLGLDAEASPRRVLLTVEGLSNWKKGMIEAEGFLSLPPGAPLDLDVGVGDLEIEGLTADQRIDLGVGEVTVRVPKTAVASVELDAGVGEAEIFGADGRIEGRRSMLVGSEAYWSEGPGEARIRVEVGVGEISVWLE